MPAIVSTLQAALLQRPDAAYGVPTGWGDWRIVVDALLVQPNGALVGQARVGTARVAGRQWRDLTPYVTGLEWRRGASSFAGRPDVGIATMTVESPRGLLASWNTGTTSLYGCGPLFGPGLVVRVSLISPTATGGGLWAAGQAWLPQFVGVVESWPSPSGGVGAYEWSQVTFVELLTLLARVDPLGLGSPVGAGETFSFRVPRILKSGGWAAALVDSITPGVTELPPNGSINEAGCRMLVADPFIEHDNPLYFTTLIATAHSAVPSAELYLVADSIFATIRSGRDGFLEVVPRTDDYGHPLHDVVQPRLWMPSTFARRYLTAFFGSATPTLASDPSAAAEAPFVADSITPQRDDEAIRNAALIATGGGTAYTARDAGSIARYGERTERRTDLIAVDPGSVQLGETLTATFHPRGQVIADGILRRARLERRTDAARLDSLNGAEVWPMLAVLDLGDPVNVRQRQRASHPGFAASNRVRAMTHRITPMDGARIHWTADLALDTIPGTFALT